jgi:hypothetical protein
MQFSEVLMRVGTDAMRTVAAVIWPDEHIVLRKIKIRQLRDDLAKLNQVDPSTVLHPPQPPSGGDLGEHHALMRRREGIFSRLPQSTKDAHPEIYAMSISQMVQSGIVTQALVDNVESAVREWENEEADKTSHGKAILPGVERDGLKIRLKKSVEDIAMPVSADEVTEDSSSVSEWWNDDNGTLNDHDEF